MRTPIYQKLTEASRRQAKLEEKRQKSHESCYHIKSSVYKKTRKAVQKQEQENAYISEQQNEIKKLLSNLNEVIEI